MKIAKVRFVLSSLIALVMGVVLTPAVLAGNDPIVDPTDPFGTKPISGASGSEGIILGGRDLRDTIAQIINVALSLLGIVAVVIVLIGGFKWMTAGGSEDKIGEARSLIFAGIIGMAIILSAWAITKFVLNALGRATSVENFQQIR